MGTARLRTRASLSVSDAVSLTSTHPLSTHTHLLGHARARDDDDDDTSGKNACAICGRGVRPRYWHFPRGPHLRHPGCARLSRIRSIPLARSFSCALSRFRCFQSLPLSFSSALSRSRTLACSRYRFLASISQTRSLHTPPLTWPKMPVNARLMTSSLLSPQCTLAYQELIGSFPQRHPGRGEWRTRGPGTGTSWPLLPSMTRWCRFGTIAAACKFCEARRLAPGSFSLSFSLSLSLSPSLFLPLFLSRKG